MYDFGWHHHLISAGTMGFLILIFIKNLRLKPEASILVVPKGTHESLSHFGTFQKNTGCQTVE